MEIDNQEFRSGFAGLIGAPNVGKSTLLNRILGEKVAITSDKPQTTRHRILGVWTGDEAQVVFMDTPGVHQARSLLNRELVAQALSVLNDVDLVLFMVEPPGPKGGPARAGDEDLVVKALANLKKPVICVLNKIDLIKKPDILPVMDHYRNLMDLAALVPISARTGENVPPLMGEIIGHLPQGPLYYPPDTLTDQPARFIAAEMIRERVFRLTGQEIPYSAAVTVEEFKTTPNGVIRIRATIHLERDSQKKIVIGRRGAKLKEIGTAARKDIERMTGNKVFLEIFVRIQKNWSKDPNAIRRFGYK